MCMTGQEYQKINIPIAQHKIMPTELDQIRNRLKYVMEQSGTKNCSDLMALVRRAYLVWLDTFGTCLDPRRHPHFHSNHPVWLGLAEACHTTTTTHICVKSKKQVLRMNATCLCLHVCIGKVKLCECVCVRVCVYTYLQGQSELDTSETSLVGGGHKHRVSGTTMNLLACLIKALG